MKQRDYDTGLLRIWVLESKLYLTALIANSPGKSHMLLKSLTLAGHGFTNKVCVLCFSSHRCLMYSVLSLFFKKLSTYKENNYFSKKEEGGGRGEWGKKCD